MEGLFEALIWGPFSSSFFLSFSFLFLGASRRKLRARAQGGDLAVVGIPIPQKRGYLGHQNPLFTS